MSSPGLAPRGASQAPGSGLPASPFSASGGCEHRGWKHTGWALGAGRAGPLCGLITFKGLPVAIEKATKKLVIRRVSEIGVARRGRRDPHPNV